MSDCQLRDFEYIKTALRNIHDIDSAEFVKTLINDYELTHNKPDRVRKVKAAFNKKVLDYFPELRYNI